MRVTGGTLGGRTLRAPEGLETRPTTDRVREALFNILSHNDWGAVIEGAAVLDAFAGTGALGIEALSRGAALCFFFEKARKPLKILKENISSLKLEERATIRPIDATKPPPAPAPCSLVFLDPPYRKGLIPLALTALTTQGWVAPGALIVCETAKGEKPVVPPPCVPLFERTYGDTALSFFRRH